MAELSTMQDIFKHTLQDIYYAENQIAKALPKVHDAVGNDELKSALKEHLDETRQQITILEQVFEAIGERPKGEKCDAIEGLIKECDGLLEESEGTARDAGAIGCCQAIEHYEIARYGTLREWAKGLGMPEVHEMLTRILDMEKGANAKLTTLAVTVVNEASKDAARAPAKASAKASGKASSAKPESDKMDAGKMDAGKTAAGKSASKSKAPVKKKG